uniref:hypothetical protein n=1 Tax=Pelistega indica TaxID=1414851 RepID=UPI001C46FC3E
WLLSSGEGVQALFHQLAPIFQNLTLAEIRNSSSFFCFSSTHCRKASAVLIRNYAVSLKARGFID